MDMPTPVKTLLRRLNSEGYEAYAVGGCVRDFLLGRDPHDWDIATAATPEQMKLCFEGLRTIDTGIKHGTISVFAEDMAVEVTSFRADGEYKDHRRPESVRFVSSLNDDLSRRDFTVNAMAVSEEGTLTDAFGGREDLAAKLIRCVGDPETRFTEDALRILRALRFASTYEFDIEQSTVRAMRKKRALLTYISGERIYEELKRLLIGPGVARVLYAFPDVLGVIIPEILPAIGLNQYNPHHDADVWAHTARSVAAVESDPALRLAMLMHDLGKPQCFTRDAEGIGHFYGHAKHSEIIAEAALSKLKADNQTRERVVRLIRIHDMRPEADAKWIKRRLKQLGEDGLRDLLKVQRADAKAQSEFQREEKLALLDECEAMLESILSEKECFSLSQLAVNGRDLLALGLRGPKIGTALEQLLHKVIDGKLPNDHDTLLIAAKRYKSNAG